MIVFDEFTEFNPKAFKGMTQTADPFLREQQMKIRSVLRKNEARKLQGKKKRGIKWVKGKQAQCMLIGHVMIAKKCVYCGAEE